MTFLSPLPAADAARNLAVVLAVRGLQRQAAGDDAAYVENLRIGLALSQSMRDHTPAGDFIVGRAVEGTLLTGLDRWLEKLHGKPDLIRQALALLSRHLDEPAEDGKDQEAIEALIGKNTLENPLPLLQQHLCYEGGLSGPNGLSIRDEAVWVATVWLVPWEQARQDRIFRVLLFGDLQQQLWSIHQQDDLGPLARSFGPNDVIGMFDKTTKVVEKPGELCDARAMQLKLALRWYQADNGKSAENLDVLVPKYLSSVPINPFDGEPFHYRLSRGEEITAPLDPNATPPAPTVTRKIPPGQGVLQSASGDRIFIVPLPPKSK
jgi:hypothetical protein